MTRRRRFLALSAWAAALAALVAAGARAEPGGTLAADSGEVYALLVGVQESDGGLDPVRSAGADVAGLYEVLQEVLKVPADHMVVLSQAGNPPAGKTPTRAHIFEQLDLLLTGLRSADTLIVALAGPGLQPGAELEPYFCPRDGRLGERRTLVSLGEIERRMQRSRAGLKLLFLGTSRDDLPGAFSQGEVASTLRPAAGGGVVTFLGCSRGERAYEDDASPHSVFFHFVIEGLRGRADRDDDGLATLGELEDYLVKNVRNHVRSRFSALQQPEVLGNVAPTETIVAARPASLLLKRARELFANRRMAEVIAICTRLIASDGHLAEAYHLRGKARVVEGTGAVAAAIDDFTAALEHAPKSADAHFERGLLYLETRAAGPAGTDFDQAIGQGMTGRDVWFYRGMARLQQDKFREASDDFTAAIRIDPEFADAFLNRGVARFRLDLLKESLADSERAIALDPRRASAYLNRGVVRLKRGDLDAAINDFDTAIEQGRRWGDLAIIAPAYFDRGKAFYLKRDYARAIDDWQRVLRDRDDRDCMTLDYLGLAYAQLQNEFKASRYFEDAVRLDASRSYAPAHAHLGAVRYNQKNFAAAIKECTAAVEIDPNLAEAYSTRSQAFRSLRQLERARGPIKNKPRCSGRPPPAASA